MKASLRRRIGKSLVGLGMAGFIGSVGLGIYNLKPFLEKRPVETEANIKRIGELYREIRASKSHFYDVSLSLNDLFHEEVSSDALGVEFGDYIGSNLRAARESYRTLRSQIAERDSLENLEDVKEAFEVTIKNSREMEPISYSMLISVITCIAGILTTPRRDIYES